MTDVHVDELLIDYARGDLDEPERARVAAHLAVCAECRATRERFTALARTAAPAPPVHWGAYRAELRDRLERDGAAPGPLWRWLLRPASAFVAAALVAALVVAGRPGGLRGPSAPDPLALD
jgi:anti-sigma factor RsiW